MHEVIEDSFLNILFVNEVLKLAVQFSMKKIWVIILESYSILYTYGKVKIYYSRKTENSSKTLNTKVEAWEKLMLLYSKTKKS